MMTTQRQNPFAGFQLRHQVMQVRTDQQREKVLKREDPPTTQAGGAVARSSCSRGASRAQGTGWQKLDNQEWRLCLHNSGYKP